MVDISKLSRSFALVAPAAVNPGAKVLRDLGASASPVQTDLRQQSNEIRQFGNTIINQLQATSSIEQARGLASSADLSRTIADAVNAASIRMNTSAALNNQRDAQIQKNASRNTVSGAGTALSLLSQINEDNEDGDFFKALIGRSGSSRQRAPAPLDVLATTVKGPKYGEDIFERGIQPMVGAGGGAQLSVSRRALRDENLTMLVDPNDSSSIGVPVLRAVADGRYTASNDGFVINGTTVNANMTAVFDTRDPNGEDPRRSSITQNFGTGSDVLFVAGENDTLADGGEGDDVLMAEGNSTLRGGAGNDLLAGQTVFGDAGDDILFSSGFAAGGEGDDVIAMFQVDPENPAKLVATGGAGNDTIVADYEAAAYGDEGDDKIILRQGGVAAGGAGNDVITSFGRAEIDAGDGDDDIRIGGSGADFQVGGRIIAGAGSDRIESYGYTDIAMGAGNDTAELNNGGVVRFARGDGSDTVFLGDTAQPKPGEIRKINTAILSDLMPADVSITVVGFDVTIAIPNSLDSLKVTLNSLSEPFNLRFEKNGQMQVVTIQNTLQTPGPVQPLTPFVP